MFGTGPRPRCCRSEAFAAIAFSAANLDISTGCGAISRRRVRPSRTTATETPPFERSAGFTPTELRRARRPAPQSIGCDGGSVASSGALRNGFDGTGQRASPSGLRGRNKYRTFCPPGQEICRSEIVAVPLCGLALSRSGGG